jgi:cytochrome c peroxidase
MRKTSPFAILATTLIGASSFIAACEDDESTSNPSSGGSSQGGEGTGGSNGGTAGTAGSNTGGTSGDAGGGTSGSASGGRGGTGDVGGTGGVPDSGDGGMGTGGDPGGASGAGGAPGGTGGGDSCGVTPNDVEQALLERLGPLPDTVPADPTNQYADMALARTLGQRFFFDKAFSGKLTIASDLGAVDEVGKVACSSCHLGESMEDHRSNPPQVSIAAGRHTRNAPGLVNASFYTWTNWAGRFSAQWELPLPVSESGVIMNGNRLAIAHRIALRYKTDYEAIFGALDPELGTTTSTRFPPSGKPKPVTDPVTPDGPWELMAAADRAIVMRVWVNFGKALQAYMRQLVSLNTPFDDWMDGNCEAISESAKRGAQLFVGKARCNNCHSNSHFTDNGFHNLGVPQGVPPNPDQGRVTDAVSLLTAAVNSANATYSDSPTVGAARLAGLTNPMPESTRGAFRTPNLRGVAQTGPYMHSGQFATLEEVIDFYNNGGGTPVTGTRDPLLLPLGLSAAEGADLVEFLKSLSGPAVPAPLLMDTSAAP